MEEELIGGIVNSWKFSSDMWSCALVKVGGLWIVEDGAAWPQVFWFENIENNKLADCPGHAKVENVLPILF